MSDLLTDLAEFGDRREHLRLAITNADWPTTVAAAKAGVISAQSLGFRAERFVADAFGWIRVPTHTQRGDFVTPHGEYIELKNSLALNGTVLLRQIRQSQRVNWLLVLAALPTGQTEIFVLDRPAVEYESRDMHAAHGVRATATELAMAFDLDSPIHERWAARYRVATVLHLEEAEAVVNLAVAPTR